MSVLINVLAITMISGGLVFFFGAALGLLRLPDFYTRMHAAGKGDTLSSLLILGGFAVFQFQHIEHLGGWISLVTCVKILGICAFIMLTSPTSTHALMEAGYEDGIIPLIDSEGMDALEDDFDAGQFVTERPTGKGSKEVE